MKSVDNMPISVVDKKVANIVISTKENQDLRLRKFNFSFC